MKKGISMAIETVIYIILAVLVLTVLLFSFTSQSAPAQQQIDLQRQRNEICGAVATIDPKCENLNGVSKLSDLITICKKLDICTTQTDVDCVKYCCIFCPKTVIPTTPKK